MMDHLSLVPYEGGSDGSSGGGGKYKECMRNHAAAMGGQAFDGCGEYMPAASPDTLKCAACGCHRSFHRRAAATTAGALGPCAPVFFRPPPPPPPHHHHNHHTATLQAFLPSVPAAPVPPPPPPPHLALTYVPPVAWHARARSETPPGRDDYAGGGGGSGGSDSFGRKRFRTRFTPEQKERMREFADRQGWRIHRNDDGALERFCHEIGVKRQVLKVWMHNHKNQLASSSPTSAAAAAAAAGINPAGVTCPGAGAGDGNGNGGGGDDDDDDDDDDTDDSPPRAAASSPSPSPISV